MAQGGDARDVGMVWVEQVSQDLRYGVRVLLRNPLFSAVALGTLALGIAPNTAMFSLLDQWFCGCASPSS